MLTIHTNKPVYHSLQIFLNRYSYTRINTRFNGLVCVHVIMNEKEPVPKRMRVTRRYTDDGIPLHPVTEEQVNNIIKIEDLYAIHECVSIPVEYDVAVSEARFAEPVAVISDSRLKNEYRASYKWLRTTVGGETDEEKMWGLIESIEPMLENRNIELPIIDTVYSVRIHEGAYKSIEEQFPLIGQFTTIPDEYNGRLVDVVVSPGQLEWIESNIGDDVESINEVNNM